MSAPRAAVVLALLATVGVVIALLFGRGAPSKPNGAGGASTSSAASVKRRDLVETDTEAGTLSYAEPQTVYDRLSGTITWLPNVGRAIKPGEVLFTVDGAPVVLMDGSTPAYRNLAPGVGDGRDVLQLNRDLVALGCDPDKIAIDDEWQGSTTAGVEQLQRSLGEAETGKLALGQIVFLPGEQLVSGVDATLGGDGAGAGSGSPSASSAGDLRAAGAREYASLETPTPSAKAAAKPETLPRKRRGSARSPRMRVLEAQLERLKAELTRLKSHAGSGPGAGSPGTGDGSPPAGSSTPAGSEAGSGAGTPAAILQTTSARLIVTVQLEASKQSEARTGEDVTVALPDGETVGGTVTAVSAVAQSSDDAAANNAGGAQGTGSGSGNASSTIPVTITLHGRHAGAGLDQAAVSVNFVRAVARDVLSVPVTALVATGGAGYGVQEAAPPQRVIPVTTGLFAAGDVQIAGAGLRTGLRVSDSQG